MRSATGNRNRQPATGRAVHKIARQCRSWSGNGHMPIAGTEDARYPRSRLAEADGQSAVCARAGHGCMRWSADGRRRCRSGRCYGGVRLGRWHRGRVCCFGGTVTAGRQGSRRPLRTEQASGRVAVGAGRHLSRCGYEPSWPNHCEPVRPRCEWTSSFSSDLVCGECDFAAESGCLEGCG